MNRGQLAVSASLVLVALGSGACELVLGDLPAPREEQQTTSSTGATGGSGGTGATSMGGTSPTTSVSTGAAGVTTSTTSSETLTTTTTTCLAECDCDGDSHLAKDATCKGDDCDDWDPSTYPGADYQVEPTLKGGFDHDCSGTPEPDPKQNVLIKCGLVGLPCDGKKGFLGSIPLCGQPGNWGTCEGTLTPCKDHVLDSTTKLGCK